jgi:glycine/D-amino acid oxidase-like deaminating enzyme
VDTADVVVVGAGIFGSSIAFQLVSRGAGRVVLVDGRGPASGMSGRSFEQVRRHYSNEVTIRLANRGFEVFERWDDEVGVGSAGYVRLGYLLLVPEDAVRSCRRNVELGRGCGVDTRFVAPEEIAAIEPLASLEGVAGGAFEPDGGVVDVPLMVLSWVAAATSLGLRTRFGSEVVGVATSGGRVTGVRLADGVDVSSPVVVDAAGGWGVGIAATAGVRLPVAFHRVGMAWLRQTPTAPILGVCLTDTAGGLVMRPDRGRLALAVAYEANARPEPAPSFASDVDEGYEPRVRAAISARVPAYATATWEGSVSGQYDVTPDWHPLIGWAPGVEGLYLALGWSGHGLKLSPAVGEVVADEVLGRSPSIDVSDLRPDRFDRNRPMHLAYGPGARA